MSKKITSLTLIATMFALVSVSSTAAFAASRARAAKPNVVQAIKTQDARVKNSTAWHYVSHFDVDSVQQARAAEPQYTRLTALMIAAAKTVSAASAKPAQLKGKRDWLAGIKLDAKGVEALTAALKSYVRGDDSLFQDDVSKGDRLLTSGDALGSKADRALGLPSAD